MSTAAIILIIFVVLLVGVAGFAIYEMFYADSGGDKDKDKKKKDDDGGGVFDTVLSWFGFDE